MFYVTKVFYPVGQGGFYSERIISGEEERVFVYDCGSIGKKSSNNPTQELVNCICNSGLTKVDYLVISHLDEDHINGIPELEKYLINDIHVNPSDLPLVIIPQPTLIDMILFFERCSQKVISWFLKARAKKRVLYINDEMPINSERNEQNEIPLNRSLANQSLSHQIAFLPIDKNPCWKFKFYVKLKNYNGCLTQSDEMLIQKVQTIDDFEQNKGALKGIYKRVRYGMNGSSMSMASFPLIQNENNAYATWLNGDAQFKTEKNLKLVEKHFSCLKKLNVDFQVPHHGSYRNLCRLPKNVAGLRTFVWAGFDNQYGHPSGTILNMMKYYSRKYYFITEKNKPIVLHAFWR